MKERSINKKMKIGALLILAIVSTLFINSCKEEEPTVPGGTGDNTMEVVFTATANNKTFNLNDSFELSTEGFNYTFSLFKFYVSQFRLVKEDNSEVLLKDIDMIDFRSDAPNLSFKVNVPEGTYKEIKFGLGVDSITNAKNPASFPSSSPLAISKGTYWGMASQYRFFLMEGRLDSTMSTTTDTNYTPFAVHTGTNALYREKTFAKSLVYTKGDDKKITIEINIDALLSNINFKQDHVSHTLGSFETAEKVADNLAKSISLQE